MAKTYYAVGANSKFYKSTDDGNTWAVSTLPVVGTYSGVHFTDANTGIVCGYSGFTTAIILRTIDGGSNWTQITAPSLVYSPDFYNLYHVFFENANVGYICGNICATVPVLLEAEHYILKTTDGGLTWNAISFIDSLYGAYYNLALNDIKKIGSDIYFYGGQIFGHSLAEILKLDSSNNITLFRQNGDYIFYQVSNADSKTYIATEFGNMVKSQDSGQTNQNLISVDAATNCRAINFTSENTGHVGTEDGKMFRFNNSLTPTEQTYGGTSILWMDMENESSGVAVGAGGEIYKYQL